MDTAFQNKQIRDIVREELATALDTQLTKLTELNKTIEKPKRDFLTSKEVLEEFGITERTLQNWQYRGLRSKKVGRKRYYKWEDLMAYVNSQSR